MTDKDKKTVSFQVNKAEYEILKTYATQKKKTTVSWLLRDLISDFIEKQKK